MEYYIKISQFAQLSGIPRKNLIEYDKMGILKPIYICPENYYRYYSYQQLETAALIKLFRELQIPLKEIKTYIDQRSPDEFIRLCKEQKIKISEKIEKLHSLDMLLDAHIQKTEMGIQAQSTEIQQKLCREEQIFIGSPLPPVKNGMDLWNYYSDFLALCTKRQIPAGLPTGIVVEPCKMLYGRHDAVKYFYCRLPDSFSSEWTVIKPSGLYVIGYDYQSGSFSKEYYKKIYEFCKDKSLAVSGNSYEFYLFDELNFLNPHKYLVQISVPVKNIADK